MLMVMAVRRVEVLGLYRKVLRLSRSWQAQSGLTHDTETERKYITQEARSLFKQNQHLTDPELISKCVAECEARIELGLHYRNPYPRPSYLPPMGLATQKGSKLRGQQRLRKQAKPVYLQSHHET
ncbi:LYR motif containing protein 1 [Tachysurus fulvidraco]|uniref:LYR motif containing protein 1 n=1 Tax=Tachysurus fulvidraco TaxID=1234273 RepID=UPI000F4F96CC|nr:LYR motif containing protein 1 [Tachysurus fulvidraco]XP_027013580.1 LYR motif containing protein 1 [Tachysurus fulvidraco]